jgi:hypothetical protein
MSHVTGVESTSTGAKSGEKAPLEPVAATRATFLNRDLGFRLNARPLF